MAKQEVLGGALDPMPLHGTNGLGNVGRVVSRASLDLDENEEPAATANQVDLTKRAAVVTRDDGITAALEVLRGSAFAP